MGDWRDRNDQASDQAENGESNYVKWATSAGRDAAAADFAAGWRYTEAAAGTVERRADKLADQASEKFVMGTPDFGVGDQAGEGLGPDSQRSRRVFAEYGYRRIFIGAYLAHLTRLDQQGGLHPLEERDA